MSVRRLLHSITSRHTPPSLSSFKQHRFFISALCSPGISQSPPGNSCRFVTSIAVLGLAAHAGAEAITTCGLHRWRLPQQLVPATSLSVGRTRRPTDPISLAPGCCEPCHLLCLAASSSCGVLSGRLKGFTLSRSLAYYNHTTTPSSLLRSLLPKPSFALVHSTRFTSLLCWLTIALESLSISLCGALRHLAQRRTAAALISTRRDLLSTISSHRRSDHPRLSS